MGSFCQMELVKHVLAIVPPVVKQTLVFNAKIIISGIAIKKNVYFHYVEMDFTLMKLKGNYFILTYIIKKVLAKLVLIIVSLVPLRPIVIRVQMGFI